MSICLYARIQKKCITEDLLFKQLHAFFEERNNKETANYMMKEKIYTNDDIIISFIEEKEPPYNVYDFNMFDEEFEYKQVIVFDIKKEILSKEKYEQVIEFCKKLGKEIEDRILITSDVHNEICLIENEKIEWFNNILN